MVKRACVAIGVALTSVGVVVSSASADITAVTVLPAGRPVAGLGVNNAGVKYAFGDVRLDVTCAANEAGQTIHATLTLSQGNGTGIGAGNATGTSSNSTRYLCPAGGGTVAVRVRVFLRSVPQSVPYRPGDGSVSGTVQTRNRDLVTDQVVVPATAIRLVAPR
jgi:hypothetical protein